ncbi:MAG: hypothetical protein ACI89L_001306 [Phycisphaerales bacterium]|jgi:hypothetical protein
MRPLQPPRGTSPSGKLCPRLILEGTRLTGKTELAFAMQEDPRFVGARKYRYHTPLISAEWGGLTDTPWGESLLSFGPEARPVAEAAWHAWLTLFESLRYEAWFVDRFHLSMRCEQERARTWDSDLESLYAEIDARLAAAGFSVVLSVRTESEFEAARTERLKISGNPSQYDDLSVFIREQTRLRELASASAMPVLEVNASDQAGSVDQIAKWLGLDS